MNVNAEEDSDSDNDSDSEDNKAGSEYDEETMVRVEYNRKT